MPTTQPRINVTVSEHQHRILKELADLQDRSASSFLREMLDAATPMLEASLPIFRAASEKTQEQPHKLQEAIKDVLGTVSDNTDQLNLLSLLAGHLPSSAANDPVLGSAATASGASEDSAPRTASKHRKRP